MKLGSQNIMRNRKMPTFMDVQHKAVEVDPLLATVCHMGVKQIHEHSLPCALRVENWRK